MASVSEYKNKNIRRERITLTNPSREFEGLSREAVVHDTARYIRVKCSNPGNKGWPEAEFLEGLFKIISVDRIKSFLKVYCY